MVEKMGRRKFLEKLGLLAAAAVTAGCAPKVTGGPESPTEAPNLIEAAKETPKEVLVTGAVEGIAATPTSEKEGKTVAECLGVTDEKSVETIRKLFPTSVINTKVIESSGRVSALDISVSDADREIVKESDFPWLQILALKELTSLKLNKCGLTIVPSRIDGLTNLSFLDLSYNNVKALPVEMCQMSTLESLDLGNNGINNLYPILVGCSGIKNLFLLENELQSLPPEIGRMAKSVVKLDLAGNKLQGLPREIGDLEHLEVLFLDANELHGVGLPDDIVKLKQLVMLSMANNYLSGLPESIAEMDGLIFLKLSGNADLNYLGSLPKGLKALLIDSTDLSFYTMTRGNLSNLNFLDIRDSRFERDLREQGITREQFIKEFPNLEDVLHTNIQ